MIDLEIEYRQAEKEYDLSAFDTNLGMVYELTVCRILSSGEDIEEEVVCARQTMCEIKTEIQRLSDDIRSSISGLLVIAYEEDDSRPVPAYLVIRKEF